MPLLALADLADFFPGVYDLPSQLMPRSVLEYQADAQQYLAWCGYDAARVLDHASLRAWRQHMASQTALSPRTINRRLAAIKRLVRCCVEASVPGFDPTLLYHFAHVRAVPIAALRHRLKVQRPLSPLEVRQLCHTPDPLSLVGLRDRALLHVLAGSGCRISEVLALTVGDLMPWKAHWVVRVLGKGQAHERYAPLSHEAREALKKWLYWRAEKGHVNVAAVFTAFRGRHATAVRLVLQRRAAWGRIKFYGAQLHLPWLGPHDFRRFVGTQIAAKHGLRQAQKALGHKRLETTAQHYVLDELEPGLTEGLF